jgi:PAS domain S-box-containing protein
VAVLVLTPDAQLRIAADGTWLEATPAVAELLGYTPKELVGRRASELVHPDDRDEVVAAMRARLRVSSRVILEVRFLRRDGSVLDADARLDAERDAAGEPIGYTVTIRDASDRRRVEALRARWELLFRATSRGIAVTDPATGLLESVNPAWAAMHGGAEADFVGTRVASALTPGSAARLPALTATLHPGEMVAYESEHVRLDGTTFPAAVELMATLDGVEGTLRWLTWVDDLTERRRAEEAVARHAGDLARSNADLDRFAAVVTHDLQSPLRVIVGSARILERRAGAHLSHEERELIGLIANGARRMAALVDGVRAYSGVRGHETADEALPLRGVVDEVVAAMHGELEAAGARIAVGDLPTVCGDPVGLTQLGCAAGDRRGCRPRRRRRLGRDRGRQRDRHRAGGRRAHLRVRRPAPLGRRHRRHRHRPGRLQDGRGAPRRAHLGRARARRRQRLPLHAPAGAPLRHAARSASTMASAFSCAPAGGSSA